MSLQTLEWDRDDAGFPLWVLWQWCGLDHGELGPQARPLPSCLSETGVKGPKSALGENWEPPAGEARDQDVARAAHATSGTLGTLAALDAACHPRDPALHQGGSPPSTFSRVTPSRAWHVVEAQSPFAECELVLVLARQVTGCGDEEQ